MATSLPLLQYDPEADLAAAQGSRDSPEISSSHQAPSSISKVTSVGHAARQSSPGNDRADGVRRQEQRSGQESMNELSRERRRRAFIGMLKLLEHGAKNAAQLSDIIAPMSDDELLQVAEERALAGKCGNPLCSRPFSWEEPKQKYRVTATNIHKVEGDCYCSKSCRSFILQLSSQLVNPLDRIQPQALQRYLAQPSHKPKQGVAAQGGGVPTMKSIIQERDIKQIAQEAEQAGKQLDEAAAEQQQARAHTAALVEGFIPRAPPSRHQQQQQKQQHSKQEAEAADAGFSAADSVELSQQLSSVGEPAVPPHPVHPAAGAGNHQQEVEMQAYREHQEHQLRHMVGDQSLQQQLGDNNMLYRQQQAAPVETPNTAPAPSPSTPSSSTASAPKSAPGPVSQAAVPDKAPTSEAAADSQPPRRKRQVTFAPNVEYSCPAEPQDPPEQPVLTFTMHDPGSPLDLDSSSSGGGMMGELRLTSADDVEPQQAAAADSDDSESQGGGAASANLPEAWRLFFPPALGGVGVPVKQLVQTRPLQKTKKHSQQSAGQRQQQQQSEQYDASKLQQQQASSRVSVNSTVTTGNSDTGTGHTAGVAAESTSPVTASGTTHQGLSPTPATRSQGDTSIKSSISRGLHCTAPVHQQLGTNGPSALASAAETTTTAAPAPAGGAGTRNAVAKAASTGSVASKPRKFSPFVRPRRSVVVLDAAPDVVVKQRGVLPKSVNASDSSAVQGLQLQQLHTQRTAAAAAAGKGMLTVSSGQNGLNTTLTPADSSSSSSDESEADTDTPECDHLCAANGMDLHQGARVMNSRTAAYAQCKQLPGTAHRNSRMNNKDNSDSEDSSTFSDHDDQEDADQGWGDSNDDGEDDDLSDGEGDDEAASSDVTKQLQGALQSLVPFLDTKGVTVHLSEFGLMWNALHAWVSPATQAYVNNKEAAAAAVSAAIDRAVAAACGKQLDAVQDDAVQEPVDESVPSMFVLQQRTALANMLAPALPLVVEQLSISVPQAELNRHLHALVRSFYMSGPLPAFQLQHWQIVVALMLAALSAWRIPGMRQLFSRRQPSQGKLEQMLAKLGTDVDRFMALLDLFELNV